MERQTSVAWSDTAAHNSGFVTANGIRLHYLDWGGLGPALILIHGGLDNAHVFDDLAPALTSHFRVIAYDLRGHGHSDAKGPFDTATRAEDLCGLMDRLGITKAHLAGWSLGGNDITPWPAPIRSEWRASSILKVRTIGAAQAQRQGIEVRVA